MPSPRSLDPWTLRARAFWQERQKRAIPGALTGYLLDESPSGIGERRFRGEWAQVQPWLAAAGRGRCLDVGCGTGVWLRALAGRFDQVEGWDYAPAMVAASRRTLKEAGLRNATLFCGQITRRKGAAVFDVIFVGGVLMYTPEPALGPLLKSLARLLKPGGLLLLRESTTAGPTWRREGLALRPGLLASAAADLDYVAVYRSQAVLRAALAKAGLSVRRIEANSHYKFSDLTEDWLRRWEALTGGGLGGDPARAERLAAWIYHLRVFLFYPEYFVRHTFGLWPWKLQNDWFLCARS